MLEIPLYNHDCTSCIYLGEFNSADLYFCQNGRDNITLVARKSSEPCDYNSGLNYAVYKQDPFLVEALKRAKEKKYL